MTERNTSQASSFLDLKNNLQSTCASRSTVHYYSLTVRDSADSMPKYCTLSFVRAVMVLHSNCGCLPNRMTQNNTSQPPQFLAVQKTLQSPCQSARPCSLTAKDSADSMPKYLTASFLRAVVAMYCLLDRTSALCR